MDPYSCSPVRPIWLRPASDATPTEGSFTTATNLFTSNPNIKNFDPRIGLAFDPFADHKTSIRAGFAMFHEPITARTFAFMSLNPTEPLT